MTFSFVDIETTGTRMRHDRVIEIGILRVEDGRLVRTYNQLINPQTHVSPFISQMTGIYPDELEDAPTFDLIKDDVYELLQGSIFVAHNVRFDHGFLKNEFRRYDLDLSLKQLCTVKLSRTLFPEHRHHNLDAIVQRFGFSIQHRHRAFDDAEVLWKFYQAVEMLYPANKLQETLKFLIQKPSLPTKLPIREVDNLHDGPGVYIFYGEEELPLYIGKSKNVRKRVLSHFSSDHSSSKEMNISQQIKHIETIPTAGELGALLKEAELIKKMNPVYNQQLRRQNVFTILTKEETKERYQTVSFGRTTRITTDILPQILGIFRSKKQAKEFVEAKALEHKLCGKLLGLEKTKGACFGHKLERCKGACLNKEKPIAYNIRFIEAFGDRTIKEWPFPGPIRIHEEDSVEHLTDDFIIDKWCLVTEDEERYFDYDIYKILVRYLFSAKNQFNIKIITQQKEIPFQLS
ncbi:GIY-YIG nuclease family protein [Candidatus Roizmanbacteria bacterium]|nr:MAG: GIY-YIG nuclease family protein [Candidatus Roizmanbacteria bacterium]